MCVFAVFFQTPSYAVHSWRKLSQGKVDVRILLLALCNKDLSLQYCHILTNYQTNKTLGRAQDPRANGAWLSKLTE